MRQNRIILTLTAMAASAKTAAPSPPHRLSDQQTAVAVADCTIRHHGLAAEYPALQPGL
jgi:hypothetical protein